MNSIEDKEIKHKVVLVDDEELILSSARRLFRGQPWDLVMFQDPCEALDYLKKNEFSVLVSDQRMPGMTGIELLVQTKKTAPLSVRMMLTGFLDDDVLEEAINEAGVFRFLAKPWDDLELINDINKAIARYEANVEGSRLLEEVSQQSKELEGLTTNLERIVAQRTETIEGARAEAEKIRADRQSLVEFVRGLGALETIEDWLVRLRSDMAAYADFGEVLLVYTGSGDQKFAVSVLNERVTRRSVSTIWPRVPIPRDGAGEDQKWVADFLGRPVAKVLTLPLGEADSEGVPTLFWEHALVSVEADRILAKLFERLLPLRISLDRILLALQLRHTSREWEETFDAAQDPIAIIDGDFSLLRSNQSFSKHAEGSSCYSKLAGTEHVCSGCPVREVLEKDSPQVGKVSVGGSVFEVHSYPIYLPEDGRIVSVVNHYVDITHSQELYGQLIQNEKMAAVGNLAGNIAHELNNPLTGIRSLVQVLGKEVDSDSTLSNDLKEIGRATSRSQAIIKNLLEFSQPGPQAGVSKVSLNDLVTKTLPMLKTAMRKHTSEIELSEDGVDVSVEPHLMQQVIFNMVNNACQAMVDTGTITICTKVSGSNAELLIGDTGPGISKENLEKVFDAFFTTKPEGLGTGLGLSVAKAVVEKSGGQVDVESSLGEGTRFMIRLPLVKPEGAL